MARPDHRGSRPRRKPALSLEEAFRSHEQKAAAEPTLEGVIEAQRRSHDLEEVSNLDLDPIEQAVLDHQVMSPDPYHFGPAHSYSRGEVNKAKDLARVWHEAQDVSSIPLDDDQVVGWIALHPAMTADAMLTLVAKGLTSETVAIRAWYGLVNPDRPRLIDRFVRDELSADEVVAELNKALTKRAEAERKRRNA